MEDERTVSSLEEAVHVLLDHRTQGQPVFYVEVEDRHYVLMKCPVLLIEDYKAIVSRFGEPAMRWVVSRFLLYPETLSNPEDVHELFDQLVLCADLPVLEINNMLNTARMKVGSWIQQAAVFVDKIYGTGFSNSLPAEEMMQYIARSEVLDRLNGGNMSFRIDLRGTPGYEEKRQPTSTDAAIREAQANKALLNAEGIKLEGQENMDPSQADFYLSSHKGRVPRMLSPHLQNRVKDPEVDELVTAAHAALYQQWNNDARRVAEAGGVRVPLDDDEVKHAMGTRLR